MDKKSLIICLKSKRFEKNIIDVFKKIPREDFIPKELKAQAYEDTALPIGHGATISQPYTIAFMLNLLELKKGQKILEIGSGSGYVLAILESITKGKIYGVEIIKELADSSKKTLKNYKNIKIINQSAKIGLPKFAPYDRILISASANEVPYHLIQQLKENGIIVSSVKNSIVKIKKSKDKITTEEFPGFVFVPLVD